MKSLQVAFVESEETERNNYSDLQVLKSGAGYYIGTMYTDPDTGFVEPGSRDSCYFHFKEDATKALAELEKLYIIDKDTYLTAWEEYLQNNLLDPYSVGYRLHP